MAIYTRFGAGLELAARTLRVLFGTDPGTVAPGEKLPGPHPIDTTGATAGQTVVYDADAEAFVPGVGSGGVANPLVADLDADGHQVTGLGTPSADGDAATKGYVDDALRARPAKTAAVAARVTPLPAHSATATTLTASSNGALPAVDGVTLTAAQRVLVAGETDPAENGVYAVTQVGDGSHPWILTRATDADAAGELAAGAAVFVSGGDALAGHTFTLLTTVATLGTTAQHWRDVPTNARVVYSDDEADFPYTPDGTGPLVLAVDATSFNADYTVYLPDSMDLGAHLTWFDVGAAARTYGPVFTPTAGGVVAVRGGVSTLTLNVADGWAEFVHLSASPNSWAFRGQAPPATVVLPLAPLQETVATAYEDVVAFYFDPAEYAAVTSVVLRVLLKVDTGGTVSVSLYNQDDVASVEIGGAGDVDLSSTNATGYAVVTSVNLNGAFGFDSTDAKVYVLRIKTSSATYLGTLGGAQLVVTP